MNGFHVGWGEARCAEPQRCLPARWGSLCLPQPACYLIARHDETGWDQTGFFLLAKPARAINPEPKSQMAGGTGTGEAPYTLNV
jgi:hypothetical protein